MATTIEPMSVELADGRHIELHESVQLNPNEFGLGAYHEGELVGLLVCEADSFHNGHVSLFVKPEWRDVGVGAVLVRRMAERGRDFGLSYLTLSYGVDNVSASKMLTSTGLVVARRVRAGVEKAAVLVPTAPVLRQAA